MKKNFAIFVCLFGFLAVGLFAGFQTEFAHAENSDADSAATTYYSYTESDGVYTISSSNSEASYTTINSILKNIASSDNKENTPNIKFDNIENVVETIALEFSVSLSGSISSNFDAPVFVVGSGVEVTLSSLTVSGKSTHLIETSKDSTGSKIIVEGGNFSSSNSDASYAIYFYGTSNTLEFSGVIKNSCDFFTRSNDNVTITMTGNLYLEEDEESTGTSEEIDESDTINIALAYDADDDFIAIYFNLEYYSDNYNYVKLVPAVGDAYSIVQIYGESEEYCYWSAYAKINITFDAGDGVIYQSGYKEEFYYNSTNIVFPEGVERGLYTFSGWFGRIVLTNALKTQLDTEANYLYFDANALKSWMDSGSDVAKLTEYFSLSADSLDSDYSLTSYNHNSAASETFSYYQEFYGIAFMLEMDSPVYLVAGWQKETFTISFETGEGSLVDDMVMAWGETLTAPNDPTLEGYTFAGWFTDEKLTTAYSFKDATMPTYNFSLYASWQINTYTITLHYNNDGSNGTLSLEYAATIEIDDPEKTGYDFAGWFADENLTKAFTLTAMPAENINIYAAWQIKSFNVIFNSNGGTSYPTTTVNYGETVTKPTDPEKTGSTFMGWYTDNGTFLVEYDFDLQVTSNLVLYAKWYLIEYTITFNSGSGSYVDPIHAAAGDTLVMPDDPTLTGYTFLGWFTDEALTEEFTLTTMPAYSLTLYAAWEAKLVITLYLDAQTYDYEESFAYYKNFSDISGFSVFYLVDGTWTTTVPTLAGTYDIKVVRAEDDTYQAYEQVFEALFTINHRELNLSWVYAILFSLALIETGVVLILRHMKKMKTSRVFAIAPVIVGENYMIAGSEFVLLIVSGALALIGFVAIIFMLVNLHRTARNDAFFPSDLDNRERFKEDLVFQNENNGDDDYFVSAKSSETFGEKYSAEDIKNMLENDSFAEEIAKRKKFNLEDNSSTNWNRESETDGSDVIFMARELDEVAGGAYDDRVPVKFFDDEDDEPAEDVSLVDIDEEKN